MMTCNFGDIHLKFKLSFGMHSIAVLALIQYFLQLPQQLLQPVDGASFVLKPSTSMMGLLRNNNVIASNIGLKSKSSNVNNAHSNDNNNINNDYSEQEQTKYHHHHFANDNPKTWMKNRRQVLQTASYLSLTSPLLHPTNAHASSASSQQSAEVVPTTTSTSILPRGKVFEIEDPNSYSAVVYIPPSKNNNDNNKKGTTLQSEVESYPLLVVLHGAGTNEHSALYEFTHVPSDADYGDNDGRDGRGDHTNLPPYLLSTNQAPSSLSENFIVVAPYVGRGKRSLYDEPRGKLLGFVRWFNTWIESQTIGSEEDDTVIGGGTGTATTRINNNKNENENKIAINRQRVSLFSFSEGSTLAVELATTRAFAAVILCSYGFTGTLPKMAIEKLQGIPMWIFHSKGDDVYDIQCSNKLVDSLLTSNESGGSLDVFGVGDMVKFTKLIPSQKQSGGGSGGNGYEHVRSALVASKDGEVYSWLLSLK